MTIGWALVILAFLVTSPIWGPIVVVAGVFALTCIVCAGVFAWIAILEFIDWAKSQVSEVRRRR